MTVVMPLLASSPELRTYSKSLCVKMRHSFEWSHSSGQRVWKGSRSNGPGMLFRSFSDANALA